MALPPFAGNHTDLRILQGLCRLVRHRPCFLYCLLHMQRMGLNCRWSEPEEWEKESIFQSILENLQNLRFFLDVGWQVWYTHTM